MSSHASCSLPLHCSLSIGFCPCMSTHASCPLPLHSSFDTLLLPSNVPLCKVPSAFALSLWHWLLPSHVNACKLPSALGMGFCFCSFPALGPSLHHCSPFCASAPHQQTDSMSLTASRLCFAPQCTMAQSCAMTLTHPVNPLSLGRRAVAQYMHSK